MTKERFAVIICLVVLVGVGFSALVHFALYPYLGFEAYPYSTFLGLEGLRYGDFYDTCDRSLRLRPYDVWTLYFPATFLFFRTACLATNLTISGLHTLYISFFVLNFSIFFYVTTSMAGFKGRQRLYWFIALSCSYPMLYAWDRGNIELLILNLIALSFYLPRIIREPAGALALSVATSMKGMPGIFSLRYALSGQWLNFGFGLFSSFALTLLGLTMLGEDFSYHLRGLAIQHEKFNLIWAYGLDGLSRSTSAFGMWKTMALLLGMDLEDSNQVSSLLWLTTNAMILITTVYGIWVRKVRSEALVFLSCALIYLFLPKVSGDYKAIILLLFPALLTEQEWLFFDLRKSVLYGMIFVPKNFIVLTIDQFLRFDIHLASYFTDITIGALLNPLLILIFFFLFARFRIHDSPQANS